MKTLLYAILILTILLASFGIWATEESKKNSTNPDVKYINVQDIKIGYQEIGTGKPLVLIMGYGSTMDIWPKELISSLSDAYKVIIFDNRGMGDTTAGTKEFSIRQFADDTAGFMQALKIEKAHILGWSMGSYIAQELAINYPNKTDKMILYGATMGGEKEHQPDAKTLAILTDYSGTPQQIGERFFKLLFPAVFLENNPEFYKSFPQPTEHTNPADMGKQSMAIGKWPGTYGRIKSLTCPTLLLTGTDDVIVPPANSVDLSATITSAWLIQINGAGHGLMYQYPEKTLEVIKTFLQ